jgi:hypothetical protein
MKNTTDELDDEDDLVQERQETVSEMLMISMRVAYAMYIQRWCRFCCSYDA